MEKSKIERTAIKKIMGATANEFVKRILRAVRRHKKDEGVYFINPRFDIRDMGIIDLGKTDEENTERVWRFFDRAWDRLEKSGLHVRRNTRVHGLGVPLAGGFIVGWTDREWDPGMSDKTAVVCLRFKQK